VLRRFAAALASCAVCAVCAVCGSAACTLLVDTGGLSSAGADASSNDGDVIPMVPGAEGGSGSDAAANDAAANDGATASSVCTAVHTFCDDFDTGDTNLLTRWGELNTAAGPLDLDTTRSKSPPRSLRMNVMPETGVMDSHVGKTIDVKSGTGRVELDLFVPAPGGSYAEVDPIGIVLTPTPAGYDFHGLYLLILPGGNQLQYFASKKSGNLDNRAPVKVTTDAWHHIVMTFSYTASPTGTMTIDGDAEATVAMGSPTPTKLDLQLGASYANNVTATWSLGFDNVVIDTP
jgi:hypothetical protein